VSQTVQGKAVAAVAMVTCCGLSMAIALGIVVISSTLLVGAIAATVAAGCVLFMLALGHRHGGHSDDNGPRDVGSG
jgi:predicted anti-sigma-YlaC factor YlaD